MGEFSTNHPLLFVLAGLVVAFVLAQSLFFLIKALKRSKEIGMDQAKLKQIIVTAAVFTIAPAIAIVISVITLSKDLGLALPWLRLSVVGSLSYETVAAANAESAMGLVFGQGTNLTATQFVTIALVMTVSIINGIITVPIVCQKYQKGMINLGKKDAKWSDILQNSLFIGMISAFLGNVFCNVDRLWKSVDGVFTTTEKVNNVATEVKYTSTSGLVPVFVFLFSAMIMCIFGVLAKKTKARWINDYALPICLIAGMAFAIPLTAWLGNKV